MTHALQQEPDLLAGDAGSLSGPQAWELRCLSAIV